MRVIAGTAKGREIIAPKGRDTRPTLAKVREAMFGMVQFDVPDAVVLDLFAGSGALGIEALSRGAARAVLCDIDRQAASAAKVNLERLGFQDRASVICRDSIAALDGLAAAGERFSLVLIDPPYAAGLTDRALERLVELDLLEDGALILCEHSTETQPRLPQCMHARAPKRYGDTALTLISYSRTEANV